MLGFTLHFLGDPQAARAHLERMLARPAVVRRLPQIPRFQFDQWVTARITLAEILWLLGLPTGMLGIAWPSMRAALDAPLAGLGVLLAAMTATRSQGGWIV